MKKNLLSLFIMVICTVQIHSLKAQGCDAPTGATGSAFLGTSTNPGNAIDGNYSTSATLSTLISALGLGSASLTVDFANIGGTGDSLIVVYRSSSALVSLVDYLSFTFTNSSGGTYSTSSANLITLLYIGGNQYTRLAVPTNNFPFIKAKVTLSALLAVAPTASIFEIYRVPKTTITTALQDNISCTDKTTNLSTSVSPSGSYSYLWSSSNDFSNTVGTSSGLTLTNLAAGSHTYYVQATNLTCPDRQGSASITFTTYSTPSITPNSGTIFNGATRNQSYTSNTSVNITNGNFVSLVQTPVNAGFSYNNTNGKITASSVNGNATASVSNVSLIITADNNGCSSTSNYIIPLAWALPVSYSKELSASENTDGSILLTWTTGTEINNKYFKIERSSNQSVWDSIGWVNSLAPNGNGAGKDYSFNDLNPLSGISFYRLVQVDFDGVYKTSKVISVNTATAKEITVYPNPAVDKIFVTGTTIGSILKIFNTAGQLVKSQICSAQPESISLQGLPSGVYIINVQNKNARMGFVKFIKQ